MYDAYNALKVSRDEDGVVRIVLDNPPLNGASPEMHRELATVFHDIARDPQARVALVTGAGERGFCAGGDPKTMRDNIPDQARWTRMMSEARAIVLGMLGCEVPIIGRINGHAIGFGATLALCCDVILMSERAKIGDTHVNVGLAAGDGGALVWPALIGLVRAKRFLLTGELLTAQAALEAGLVTEAVPSAELDRTVDAWIRRFLATSPQALRTTKRCLNMPLLQQAQAYMDAHLGMETLTHLTSDHAEALDALIGSRSPQFRGC